MKRKAGMAVWVMLVSLLFALVGCGGGGGGSSTGGGGTDTTAPSAPTALVSAAASSSSISLNWTASTDDVGVTGYKIYRGGTQISTSATNSFSDSGLTASTNYSYTIAAYDAAGNTSTQSTSASATTLAAGATDTTAPTIPTNLTATAASASQINLSWTASTDNVSVAGYEVWRGAAKLTTVTTTAYSDAGLTANMAYTYTVKAFDGQGNISGASSAATATTLTGGTGGGVAGQNWSIRQSNQMNLASNCTWFNSPPVWSGTNTMQQGYGITWSGTKFVAVGDFGSILSSPDGVSWTMQSAGNKTLRSVVWSENQFVAVGDNGSIVTSGDSSTWTNRTSGTTKNLNAVATSSSKFVAVGDSGTILTSTDGSTWTAMSSGITEPLYGVTWSGSQFVAVGYKAATSLSFASGVILTSPDGLTWTYRTSNTDQVLYGITWSGSAFVAVGATGVILTSTDGIAWTSQATTNTLTLNSVIWTGSQFIAVGGSHDSGFMFNSLAILTSPDGTTWTKISTSANYYIRGIAWSGSVLAAVGNGYIVAPNKQSVSPDVVFTSATGATWTPRVKVEFKLKGIAGSNSLLVAVGTDAILSSVDGISWSINAVGVGLNAITWAGNKFVAVGDGGAIKTSTDGITWTTQASGTAANLYGITWTGTQSIAVGTGTILTSTDNIAWTVQSFSTWPNSACTFYGIAWSGAQFVAVGYYYNGSPPNVGNQIIILSSPDGITWTARVPNSNSRLTSVVWGNNKFVVVGDSNLYSLDGITWSSSAGISFSPSAVDKDLTVTWSGTEFVTVRSGGGIFISADGATWTSPNNPYGQNYSTQCTYGNMSIVDSVISNINFTGITWFGTKFVAIASQGNFILTSP